MPDWNCTSDSLSKGGSILKYRSNGVNRYGIRVEHIIVEGGYVDLEVKFREDWEKNTDYISLRSGGKWTYTDPDSGKWEIKVTSISGDGMWATVTAEVCYYGGPEASITDSGHDGTSRKAGELVDIHPDVCNIGNLAGTFDIKFYEGATLLATTGTGRLVAGQCANNYSTMLTMPDRDFVVTMKIYLRGTSTVYDEATATVPIETTVAGNGFTIRTSLGLATKTVLVAHVVKMPFIGLVGPDPDLWYWPQAFDYVGGKWYMTDPATTYRVEVGSIFETIPSFDKTYGTGSFADGIHCIVLAEGDGGVGSLIFKGEDVFQLFKDSPTEIYLSSTSTDLLTEAVMGPVCDFFGIPRGSQCDSFWAEFYDPVYVANYISIKQTGKDTLGNERELSGFDHIALPFAVLGSLPGLSLLPFGALVTKGLGAVSKAGTKFGDEAVQFMLNFSMDATNKISSKDTWRFLDAIGQVTEDHATEIVNALTAGDANLAETLLRKYAGESKGWWDYHALNDMLRDALPADSYNWLRTQIGLTEIGAGTVTNTAKQATLSADDIAKLADAAKDSGVMDEVTAAVCNTIKNIDTTSVEQLSDLRRVIRNTDGLADKLLSTQKSVINTAVGGKALTDEELKVFLNYGTLLPQDISSIAKSMSHDDVAKLFNGANNQVIGNFMENNKKNFDIIGNLGIAKRNNWVEGNINLARKALDSAEPAKMSDIPHAAQEYAVSYADVATDMGGNIADDIIEATDDLVVQPTSNWRTTAKQTVKNTSNKFWNYFNGLSDAGQERVVHGMVAGTLVFAAVVLYKIYTDAGPQSLNHNLFTSKMESLYWPCFHACEDERADDLDAAIKLYESVINECAESLYDYKDVLEADGTYEEFSITLQIHKFNLSRLKSCLERLQPRGNIHCTSNEDFFYVDLDGQPEGFSYANREVLLRAVKVGSHTVKIHKHGYTPECTESVNVTEGTVKTVDCQMTETGACSPITAVSIYIDPLSPVEDQTVSFNGSAKSNDPITSWEWDFGDGSTVPSTGYFDNIKIVNRDFASDDEFNRIKRMFLLLGSKGITKIPETIRFEMDYTHFFGHSFPEGGPAFDTEIVFGVAGVLQDDIIVHEIGHMLSLNYDTGVFDEYEEFVRLTVLSGSDPDNYILSDVNNTTEDFAECLRFYVLHGPEFRNVINDLPDSVLVDKYNFMKETIFGGEEFDGDGFPASLQAVTHIFRSAGIYTVVLKVTNDCGDSEFTTRNVTVSEEEPPTESTTLAIETPIGEDGKEIDRYWDIEIWVDGKDTACNPPKTLTFGTNVFCDCTSPWNLVPCELGQHTITLKKYGYDAKSISVYLRKDEPKTWESPVMVESVAPPTEHTISFSVPIGSTLYVDGKPVTGTTTVGRLTTIFNELRKR